MPREWPFGARSRGSPKKCATAEPPPVPAELTEAFVDRASIDWTALLVRTRASTDRSILENLRFLDSIRTPADRPQQSAAPVWPVRLAVGVLALAAIQTACGFLVLALSFISGTPPVHRATRIAIAVAFAVGTALLGAVSSDRRRLFLLTAFACAASAFTRGALAGLPAGRVGALAVVFRGLLPEAFVPAVLWQFALLFPRVRRFTPFDVAARHVAALASFVGL